jgi:hypothetical protein
MAQSTASSAAVPEEAAERRRQLVHGLAGGHRHSARAELEDLLDHRRDVGGRRDRHDLDTIGMHPRHVERARADRSRGA